jgi:hypothetical protein
MKWVMIAAAVVVALVLVVVVIGALLPRDHVATLTARIAAPADSVWAALTDPGSFPAWRPDVQRVEMLPPTPTGPSWREHARTGAITYVIDAWEPPRRMIARIADRDLPFGGSWEYRVEPDGPAATQVTIIERGSVYNPVFRFMSRFVMGQTATIDAYLRALARRFGSEGKPTRAIAGATNGV